MIIQSDNVLRAKEVEAYEAIGSLDRHGEIVRLILAEVSLLSGQIPFRPAPRRAAHPEVFSLENDSRIRENIEFIEAHRADVARLLDRD